jgi:hypothetical protein
MTSLSASILQAIVKLMIPHHDYQAGLATLRLFQGSCSLWVSRVADADAINLIEPDVLNLFATGCWDL